jgi:DNA polymerase III epsilon subunit-like protein
VTSTLTAPAPVASTDIETTGLDPIRHDVWEVAVKRRDLDGSITRRLWQIRPASLRIADPEGLEKNRYAERMVVPDDVDALDMTPTLTGGRPEPLGFMDVARQIHDTLTDTVMIGSNSHFDASFLHRLIQVRDDAWHYRPVCVVTHAAGALAGAGHAMPVPWRSHDISRALGVEPPAPDVAHTAMGDAEWALELWDAANRWMAVLRGCIVPGCLAQFDSMAAMAGHTPARPAWSGKGWQQIRGTGAHPAGAHICPAHTDLIDTHRPRRGESDIPGGVEVECACGWSTRGLLLTWHGATRGMWEQHLIEAMGGPIR